MTLKQLADAPVSGLQGVSESDAQHLQVAFQNKTIRDLANNKSFKWARGIVILADLEE